MHRLITTAVFFFCVFFAHFPLRSEAGDTWLIDTRRATEGSLEQFRVDRLTSDDRGANRWQESVLDDFLGTYEVEKPLLVAIHGNWMSLPEARGHGIAFDKLTESRGEHRLLIWCWSSDRLPGRIRQDALIKGRRAEREARNLSALLKKLPAGSKVSLVGFSFGARLVCNTLQTLADSPEVADQLRLQAVLLAAAADRDSLAPGGKYGRVSQVTEQMLVHVNGKDKTLFYYPLLIGLRGPKAIGKEGIGAISREDRAKIKTVDVSYRVGRDHGFLVSFRTFLAYSNDFRRYALFEETPFRCHAEDVLAGVP